MLSLKSAKIGCQNFQNKYCLGTAWSFYAKNETVVLNEDEQIFCHLEQQLPTLIGYLVLHNIKLHFSRISFDILSVSVVSVC